MNYFLLFIPTLALVLFRILRPAKLREKFLLLSLVLLLLLDFGSHRLIEGASAWLNFVEKAALFLSFVWLATDPILAWLEKRSEAKRAFVLLKNGRGPLSEIVNACRILSQTRQGALIAIERNEPLNSWIDSGVGLDAKIRRETIYSVFTPPGALHDGGMIIRGDRIAACSVVFPLSETRDLPTELGTRHRAALGLSEKTDALAITISEETGKISLADHGSLVYDVKLDQLPVMLEKALRHRLIKAGKKKKSRAPKPAVLILPKTT